MYSWRDSTAAISRRRRGNERGKHHQSYRNQDKYFKCVAVRNDRTGHCHRQEIDESAEPSVNSDLTKRGALLPDGAHERLYAVHGERLSKAARAAILEKGFTAWG